LGPPWHFHCCVFLGVDGGSWRSCLKKTSLTREVPSRMLKSCRDFVKFPGSTCSRSGEVCVSNDRCFTVVFSESGRCCHWHTSFLAVSVFQCENPKADLRGCTWQWHFPSRSLVEGIVWRLDLLWGENLGSDHVGWTGRRWCLCTVSFVRRRFGEPFSGYRCRHHWWCSCCRES
jgi:hypothetical protein